MLGLCDNVDGWGVMMGVVWYELLMCSSCQQILVSTLHTHSHTLTHRASWDDEPIKGGVSWGYWLTVRGEGEKSTEVQVLIHPSQTTPLHTPHRGKCGRREWEEGSSERWVCVCVCVCVGVWVCVCVCVCVCSLLAMCFGVLDVLNEIVTALNY